MTTTVRLRWSAAIWKNSCVVRVRWDVWRAVSVHANPNRIFPGCLPVPASILNNDIQVGQIHIEIPARNIHNLRVNLEAVNNHIRKDRRSCRAVVPAARPTWRYGAHPPADGPRKKTAPPRTAGQGRHIPASEGCTSEWMPWPLVQPQVTRPVEFNHLDIVIGRLGFINLSAGALDAAPPPNNASKARAITINR